GFELSAAVAERERQIGFPGLLAFHLLGGDHERRGDDLVLMRATVADIEILHKRRSLSLKPAARGPAPVRKSPASYVSFSLLPAWSQRCRWAWFRWGWRRNRCIRS